MEITAYLKYVRVGALKASEVADLVRGCNVNEAANRLSHTQRKSGALILKLLQSALANAKQKQVVDVDSLYVKAIFVNKAPFLKRFRPAARGSANPIRKQQSHISLTLGER